MMEKEGNKPKLIFWYSIFWILLVIALYLAYFVYFPDLASTKSKWVLLFSSAITILAFACKYLEISFYKFTDMNIENEAKDLKFVNSSFYRYKNAVFVIFLIILYSIFYKHLNNLFLICSFVGMFLFLFSSKTAAKLSFSSYMKSKDAQNNSYNMSLRLKFNSACASSLLFWALLTTGIVILYHIFKDYEILSGYVFGVVFAAFFENMVCLISKKSITKVNELSQENAENPFYKIKGILKNYNYSPFFEAYIIALGAGVAVGANTIGIMGSFIPLIMCANVLFLSVVSLLLSKRSKPTEASKLHLRAILFVGIFSNLMLYFEIMYWLEPDYISIVYSSLIGTIAGIITLYINGLLKNNDLKYFANLIIPMAILCSIFIITDGMNSPLYALFSITLAILGYNSILAIVSLINQDEKFQNNTMAYVDISTILGFVASIIAFSWIVDIKEADLLNPLVLFALISGGLVGIFAQNVANIAISKQTKILSDNTDNNNLCNIAKQSVYQSSYYVIFLMICIFALSHYLYKFGGVDIILALSCGVFVSEIPSLLKNENMAGSVSGALIRLFSAIIMCIAILFI